MKKVRVLVPWLQGLEVVPFRGTCKRFIRVDNRNSPVGYDLYHLATGKSVGHGRPEWIHPEDLEAIKEGRLKV